MTSNLGAAQQSKSAIGFTNSNEGASYEAVKKFFSPEFRNRLDGTVEFVALQPKHIDMIVTKTINEINDMLRDKNITIKLSVKAKRWMRNKGYQPDMGARPLQRVVNDHIKKPLSKEILFGKLVNGGTVTVDIEDDEVQFEYS